MAEEKEAFLSRWSRLKREETARVEEAEVPAPVAEPEEQVPPLPPVEELTHDSDFTPFMHAKVPLETRRAALKKLFSDPQFSIPDPYEAYCGDWTVGEPIPEAMLRTLNQAKKILYDEPAPADAPKPGETPDEAQPEAVAKEENGIGKQDAA